MCRHSTPASSRTSPSPTLLRCNLRHISKPLPSLLKNLGQDLTLRMHTDASAVLGIAERRGVGKVRHLRAGTLGLQAKQSKNIMEILTAPGSENVADIFTKNCGQWLMQKHLASMNLEYRSGRAVTAAQFHSLLKARAGDECEERDHRHQVKQGSHSSFQTRPMGEPSEQSNSGSQTPCTEAVHV